MSDTNKPNDINRAEQRTRQEYFIVPQSRERIIVYIHARCPALLRLAVIFPTLTLETFWSKLQDGCPDRAMELQ